MAIIRVQKDKDNPYVMINKKPLNDNGLSWKAKGLLSYLLSLPDDWEINIEDLKKRSKDGKDGTAAGIKELINAGYISRETKRTEGKFKGYNYTVHEISPKREKPSTVKPFPENPSILNNDLTNIKTDKIPESEIPIPVTIKETDKIPEEEKKPSSSITVKEKEKTPHRRLTEFFYNQYFEIYGKTMTIDGKEGKAIKQLTKMDEADLIKRASILKKRCKDPADKFHVFTPSMLLSQWNKMVDKPSMYKSI